MFGKLTPKSRRAFTLTEVLLAMAVGSVIMSALLSFSVYAARSFAAMTNYIDLEQKSQSALDRMTREVRQTQYLQSYGTTLFNNQTITNSVTFVDTDGLMLTYAFNNNALYRIKNNVYTMMLTNCDFLTFQCFQRNPIAGRYEQYDIATSGTNTKVLSVSWVCSRTILGSRLNTESVQTAKIVIRKE